MRRLPYVFLQSAVSCTVPKRFRCKKHMKKHKDLGLKFPFSISGETLNSLLKVVPEIYGNSFERLDMFWNWFPENQVLLYSSLWFLSSLIPQAI